VIARHDIEAMIPHKGAMCLWDEVVDWDAQRIRLRSHGHRDAAHPLRSDGRLRAVHLVALRDVRLHVARIDDLADALECEAELLAESAASQQYSFRVVHAGKVVAEGRAAVMLQG
jgi:predicted hotdog family 3-hydroxylacyl-ACP dehydratase